MLFFFFYSVTNPSYLKAGKWQKKLLFLFGPPPSRGGRGEPIAIWGEDWFAPDKAPLTTL